MNRIKLFAFAFLAGVLLMPTAAAAQAFSPFSGSWKGSGSAVLDTGQKEAVRCTAANGMLNSGQFAIVLTCATAGTKIVLRSKVREAGGAINGEWRDVSYNNEGTLGGTVGGNVIDAKISGPVINGTVKVRRDGATLHVAASLSRGVKSIIVAMTK